MIPIHQTTVKGLNVVIASPLQKALKTFFMLISLWNVFVLNDTPLTVLISEKIPQLTYNNTMPPISHNIA